MGSAQLGALDLYLNEPGELSPEQFAEALAMAEVAAHAIVELQSDVAPDALATELEMGGGLRTVVHQASGMLSVRLGISVTDALARLRA